MYIFLALREACARKKENCAATVQWEHGKQKPVMKFSCILP